MKPRLCRSFRRAFASTHSCFLLLFLGRLSLPAPPLLFGTCLLSLWSPLFTFHAPALIPLSRQGAALAHLDSLYLRIRYFEQTALLLFLLEKTALTCLPTALSVTTLYFSAGPVCSSFMLKPLPFCTLFAGLGSTNKSAASLLLLSDFCSVFTTLSSPPSFLLP